MEIKLQAFKALAMRHADQVKATSGLQGYGLSVGGDTLHTDSNKPRVFSNLNTLANFARSIGLKSITVDLSQEPAAKPKAKKAAVTAKPAAKPRLAQKAKAPA
jgi:hypothetical protein